MKKLRMFYIFLSFILIFFALIFSSNVFFVKNIKVNCFNVKNEKINLKIDDINCSQFYNTSTLFNNELEDNKLSFEQNNPKYKLLSIEKILPNTIILNLSKREASFYICDENNIFLLDGDFKILDVCKNNEVDKTNLIEIGGENNNYFEFFEIFSCTYCEGIFLKQNNLIFEYLKNFYETINNFSFLENINKINFVENGDLLNLQILTNNDFGVKIIIENIENNFDYKLKKILNAFETLKSAEAIKTTYGKLVIDNNNNCKWVSE